MIHTFDIENDRKNGTPGPWAFETKQTSCGLCHQIGPWPHPWRGGKTMSACIYDDYPPPGGTDAMLANARRIARVPDLEDAYLAHTARIAALEARVKELEAGLRPFALVEFGTADDAWDAFCSASGDTWIDYDHISTARALIGYSHE